MIEKIKKLRPIYWFLSVLVIFCIGFYIVPNKNTNIDPEDWTQSYSPIGKQIFINSAEIKANHPVREFGLSRDFKLYECEDKRRIGGGDRQQKLAPDGMARIDGAWYTCFDDHFKIEKGQKCTVISLGINRDPSFDVAIHKDYGCQIESFDPFVEASYFEKARKRAGRKAASLNVAKDWRFHRIGLNSYNTDLSKIGGMLTMPKLWEFVGLKNQTIDIFKIDIEQNEWPFMKTIDMNYFCAHVKQFHIETHPTSEIFLNKFTQRDLKLMRKLEQCFFLFHRDTRFFQQPHLKKYGTVKTEFQDPIQYKLPLKLFGNELNLIDYMVTYGELYFVNRNFIANQTRIIE